ncbi:MAG: YbhB/YbcL family Raf kinase inhibitor-like protein [Spirochaetae bacterium HGW-Spirochaetae-7]|jgi:hypothetical protein|nr:MAG: YbhB/YbcL family Raf kinase inhibitor-like protein [Spirochaetae bacterium HGW-Spirochaetae-7]
MVLTSPDFADGTLLPFECAYDSENRSPALSWVDAPYGVKSFAVLCQDPEGPAGRPWTHWLAWNIPGAETRFAAGLPQYPRLEGGIEQGLNDYLEFGWGGPCPPVGVHTYSIMLFALDAFPAPVAPTASALLAAIADHTLGSARLEASYGEGHVFSSLVAIGKDARAAYSRSA